MSVFRSLSLNRLLSSVTSLYPVSDSSVDLSQIPDFSVRLPKSTYTLLYLTTYPKGRRPYHQYTPKVLNPPWSLQSPLVDYKTSRRPPRVTSSSLSCRYSSTVQVVYLERNFPLSTLYSNLHWFSQVNNERGQMVVVNILRKVPCRIFDSVINN